MTEIIEIIAGRYYACYPLTDDSLELAKKFLNVVKNALKQDRERAVN